MASSLSPADVPPLNATFVVRASARAITPVVLGRDRPERILQFGEGGFLRGFVDWMIHRLNTRGLFNGSIVVVQPLPIGLVSTLNEQDGLYTQILRGVQGGREIEERELISSISRGIVPQTEFESYLACARNPELRFIVSNTTEAGITCSPEDRLDDKPAASFPAKLTQFLLARYSHFRGAADKGLILLPCELIEYNGTALKRCVLETARRWRLDEGFLHWIETGNVFCNTLVDRIVTGYPHEEAAILNQELGYEDRLLNAGELFHAWVIEGPASLAKELPFAEAGLNVIWTDNYKPFRDRKVRILNGAHTLVALAAYLAGKDTVKACIDDPVFSRYIERGLNEEIIPTLDLPRADLESFAAAVRERFSNPHVRHALLAIALNSTSKFAARVLPSLKTYVARRGAIPERLTFSFAALIAFYRGTEIRDGALIGRRNGGEDYRIQDDITVLQFFKDTWTTSGADPHAVANAVLANKELWNEDLTTIPGLLDAVAEHLSNILGRGAAASAAELERE